MEQWKSNVRIDWIYTITEDLSIYGFYIMFDSIRNVFVDKNNTLQYKNHLCVILRKGTVIFLFGFGDVPYFVMRSWHEILQCNLGRNIKLQHLILFRYIANNIWITVFCSRLFHSFSHSCSIKCNICIQFSNETSMKYFHCISTNWYWKVVNAYQTMYCHMKKILKPN